MTPWDIEKKRACGKTLSLDCAVSVEYEHLSDVTVTYNRNKKSVTFTGVPGGCNGYSMWLSNAWIWSLPSPEGGVITIDTSHEDSWNESIVQANAKMNLLAWNYTYIDERTAALPYSCNK